MLSGKPPFPAATVRLALAEPNPWLLLYELNTPVPPPSLLAQVKPQK